MKRLCIIPAREGSKRVPFKNIKMFCGRPMMSYAITAAKDSGLFDDIHVSTESNAVADVARQYGVDPKFLRAPELSNDYTPLMPILKYVLGEYKKRGRNFDTVTLLYATSPLIEVDDLNKACEIFESGNREQPLLSVTPFPAPIEKAFRMEAGDRLSPDNLEAFSKRSQDLSKAYHDAAMFCFYSARFLERADFGGDFGHFRGYVIPPHRVADIDWPEDWVRAEALYRAIREE